MRLHEILSNDDWVRLQRILYASVWGALNSYQQQHAMQYTPKPLTSKLKPQAVKKAHGLARKAKRLPQVAAPKPLPKPKQQPQAQPSNTLAYQPVKASIPLPAGAKAVAARSRPKPVPQQTKLPNSLKPLPTSVLNPIDNNLPTPNNLAKNQSTS